MFKRFLCEMFHSKHWEKTGLCGVFDKFKRYNVTCKKCGRETTMMEKENETNNNMGTVLQKDRKITRKI